MNMMTARPAQTRKVNGAVFRFSRMLHAYLSAFAFLTLLFFSLTGVLLNHPEWLENDIPTERQAIVSLSPGELARAQAAPNAKQALAELVKAKGGVIGAYSSADIDGSAALIRYEGPGGTTDVDLDLSTGKGELKSQTATFNSIIQDLHRGKNSNLVWRSVIDISAIVIIALSLVGYLLFFSLRFRLTTSLLLTLVSLGALVGAALLSMQ
jgi:hypothetical protein